MKIRTKLLLLIIFFCLPLFFNLFVLGVLVRTVSQSVQTIQEVAVRQQAVTLRMQAQLRDAEAALYRYQIEGEKGFAIQFEQLFSKFAEELSTFRSLATTEKEHLWAQQLALAHQDAMLLGGELIVLRDAQSADLQKMDLLQADLVSLLTQIRLAKSDTSDGSYQTVVNAMQSDLREMYLAVIAYLATPNPVERVRFTEAAISFRFHQEQFEALISSPEEEERWSSEVKGAFEQIQALGARLINGRDQQQAQFAQFAANLFRIGQQIIVDEIQPHAANQLADAQNELTSTLNFALRWSFFVSVTTIIVALLITLPLLRQISSSIQTLLRGADRVASGQLSEAVEVKSRDELYHLGQAFNAMMAELAAREQRLHNLLQKIAIVQEEERRLVGLDLHDGLTQILLSANMHLNTLTLLATNLDAPSKDQLTIARGRLQEAIEEVNWVISELRPTEIEDFGLVDGLRHYVTKVAQHEGWHMAFSANISGPKIKPEIETAVFRIVQEALSNARKYAQTEKVRVILKIEEQALIVEVQDSGQGFEMANLAEEEKRLGLIGMQERAALLGGTLTIQSAPGQGTKICASIPVNS
ncbi:MAG: ATP-binding protein [Ardenticatenaceae bacterium]